MDKKRIIEISLMAVLVLCIVFNYISYKNKSEKESDTAASVEEQKSEIDDKTYDTYNRQPMPRREPEHSSGGMILVVCVIIIVACVLFLGK